MVARSQMLQVNGAYVVDTPGIFRSSDFAQGVSYTLISLASLNVYAPPSRHNSLPYGSSGMRRFYHVHEGSIRTLDLRTE